jgi:hypothetical protein
VSVKGFNASFGFSQNANAYSRPDQDRNASFLENRWGSGLGRMGKTVQVRHASINGLGLTPSLPPGYSYDNSTGTITDASGNSWYSNGVIYDSNSNSYFMSGDNGWGWYDASSGNQLQSPPSDAGTLQSLAQTLLSSNLTQTSGGSIFSSTAWPWILGGAGVLLVLFAIK